MPLITGRRLTGYPIMAGAAVLAGAAVQYGPASGAVVAGLLLAFALPGIAVAGVLLDRVSVSTVERIVLAPALSLGVLVLGGLGLNAARVPLNSSSWTGLTVVVTLLAAALGYLRVGPWTANKPRVPLLASAPAQVPSGEPASDRAVRAFNADKPTSALAWLPDANAGAPAMAGPPQRADGPPDAAINLDAATVPTGSLSALAQPPPAVEKNIVTGQSVGPTKVHPAGTGYPIGGRRRGWAVARTVVPVTLGAVALAAAGALSMSTAQAQSGASVTALSAVRAPVTPTGVPQGRTILIDVTSGERTPTHFIIRILPSGGASTDMTVSINNGARITRTLQVSAGRVMVELYRFGDAAPYRSVFLQQAS
ncbi:MAG: hypothetical protein QOE03_3245 [Micromonosporaceae bacterium]|nr:hypothetical protein [Micromonosporaceae bacterium]